MANSTCAVPNCDARPTCRGWCNRHYQRWYKHGDPLAGQSTTRYRTPEEAFAARAKPDASGCIVWTGSINARGYGQIKLNGTMDEAHRYAWERVNGPIPDGLYIDHRCHNPACVNVQHLRLATPKQNTEHMRGARRDNQAGIRGVRRKGNRWEARVGHNGVVISLGTFPTPEEAGEAARLKRLELFTHNDHDRKATR